MQRLLEIARGKLDNLNIPLNKEFSIIPQLMLAVFNEETPDDLDLNMYNRNEMEQEVIALLNYSDKAVTVMLGLQDKERLNELSEQLEEAQTEDQIREIIIADLLYEAMKNNSDYIPNQLKISPAERTRGEDFR